MTTEIENKKIRQPKVGKLTDKLNSLLAERTELNEQIAAVELALKQEREKQDKRALDELSKTVLAAVHAGHSAEAIAEALAMLGKKSE